MHPATPMDALPVPRTLAAMGFHVLCGRNRYYKTDHVLIFEKVLLDVGEWLRYAKEQLGYEKVVLYGWSGAGRFRSSISRRLRKPDDHRDPRWRPGGRSGSRSDPRGRRHLPGRVGLTRADPVGGHRPFRPQRARPEDRDVRLDIYSPDNPNQPPYSSDFVAEYRAAQLARMRRITARVKDTLELLRKRGGKEMERCFVTHRTMADLRYWDPAVDPNDRRPRLALQRRARNGEHRAHRGRPVLEPAVLAFAVVDR